MTTAAVTSTIERVPPMMVALLEQAGDLPSIPAEVQPDPSVRGFRLPSLTEGAALTWLLAWRGPRTEGFAIRPPSGVLGYEDRYDFHSASDVRVLTYLAGSPRAVIDLIRAVQRMSRADGRRLIGAVDNRTQPLASVLKHMGFTPTRTVFEDRA